MQPKLVKGGTTNLLPYPTTHMEMFAPMAADHAALDGSVQRDFVIGAPSARVTIQIGWEDLRGSEMDQVLAAYRGLIDMSRWTYTTPRGRQRSVTLNPEHPQISVRMTAGGIPQGGASYGVLYAVQISLWDG